MKGQHLALLAAAVWLATRQASATSSSASSADEPVLYVVKPGETLGAIAAEQLGNRDRWREIAELNGIADPRQLRAGATIVLPADARKVTGSRERELAPITVTAQRL